jgi:hypothetical protein
MAILTYERMDKRIKTISRDNHDLHRGWGAYWYALSTYHSGYASHFKRLSVDKSQQTNHRELGFSCETSYRYVVSSVKAIVFNLVKNFKAYFIDMDYRKQTNNLIYGE